MHASTLPAYKTLRLTIMQAASPIYYYEHTVTRWCDPAIERDSCRTRMSEGIVCIRALHHADANTINGCH